MPRHDSNTKVPHSSAAPGRSTVDRLHASRGISIASNLILGNSRFQFRHLAGSQPDLRRGGILLQILPALGSRNRHQIPTLRQYPRQRQLAGLYAAAPGNLSHPIDKHLVLFEVVAGEPRISLSPEVLLADVALLRN